MFIAQMAFFNRVSDPRIGGTYMTMLNTLSNLGNMWPSTLVLASKGGVERLLGHGKGFYPILGVSVVFGILWLCACRTRVAALQRKPPDSWLATDLPRRAHA